MTVCKIAGRVANTVYTLIRRHVLWRLIWVYTVYSDLSFRIRRVSMVIWSNRTPFQKSYQIRPYIFEKLPSRFLTLLPHYENTPIQIYWKYCNQKWKIFIKKKFWYFSYSCSKHRLWVLVRTASASKNKKNNAYPCKPQFNYIKVGFQGVKII